MKSRGLLLGLVVLALLLGALYWSNRQSAAKTPEAAVNSPPKILTLKQSDILKLEIRKKNAEAVVLDKAKDKDDKTNSGSWQIVAPKTYRVDSAAIDGLLSTLSSLNSERVVEEKASDLQPYGLATPSLELAIMTSGDKSIRVLLGDNTPTGGSVYAALANDPRVFTIASYVKTSLDKGFNDLRDKRFLTLESYKINRLELAANKSQIEFDRDQGRWRIVKPRPLRASDTEVDDLLRRLTEAKVDLDTSIKKPATTESSFAKAPLVGTVKLTSDAGTQELTVRKIGADYYARSTVTDQPYKIASDMGQALIKSVDGFRNKKLFDFGYNDPGKIEFHDGSKAYFLTRSGQDWWGPDGKKLDADGTYPFVAKLRGLTAVKFVESGFAAPAIQVSVAPEGGGGVEKLSIAKAGSNYVAKRENDSTLYQLDAKAVEDLQHAATELKPTAGK
jgi:hypothetical protein